MQDSTLLTLALAVGIVGVLCLALIDAFSNQGSSDNPYTKEAGDKIAVQGEVVSVSVQPIGTRIRLLVPIDVMVFRENLTTNTANPATPVNLSAGTILKVSGSVQDYQGKPEIIAESAVALPPVRARK